MDVEVRSKEEKYRGQFVNELKKLDVRATAQYLPARSRRSVLRHFDLIEKFVKRCQESESQKKKIRTHLRELVIIPHLVGKTIGVHNGKSFEDVHIVTDMIGHRLGEFSLTRKKVAHSAAGIGATKGSRALKK